MLFTKVVEHSTLDLLINVMSLPGLRSFSLVGGTALALQYGHRNSIYLDFFGNVEFLDEKLYDEELSSVGTLIKTSNSRVMLGYYVNNVKVDIVKYKYPLLKNISEFAGIRMVSPEDIAAMKLAAITGRGKKKDFYDLFELLQYYSFADIIGFYNNKFIDGNEFIVLRSISYFEDADEDEDPILYKNQDWNTVKTFIRSKHFEYLENL